MSDFKILSVEEIDSITHIVSTIGTPYGKDFVISCAVRNHAPMVFECYHAQDSDLTLGHPAPPVAKMSEPIVRFSRALGLYFGAIDYQTSLFSIRGVLVSRDNIGVANFATADLPSKRGQNVTLGDFNVDIFIRENV